jgi:transposase
MRRAFASLSEEDKNILQSSLAEGLSAREIGKQLGISRDTAQQRIGRSKERARKLFENLCKEDRGRKVTKKGDPLKLLGEMFRSGEMPPTEGEVQKSMRETTVEVSQVWLDRAHRKFVDKVFGYLHPYPVRRVTGRETFGLWLEARRRDAILIREDIARALGKDEFYVERLEIGETNPLSLNSSDAADIATLFRIHIDGIAQLISNSEAIRGRGGEIKVPVPSNVAELAREQGKPSNDPLSWLGALYEEFERRQATHLLP